MHGHLNVKLFGYISADKTIPQSLGFTDAVNSSADRAAQKNKVTFRLCTSKRVCRTFYSVHSHRTSKVAATY